VILGVGSDLIDIAGSSSARALRDASSLASSPDRAGEIGATGEPARAMPSLSAKELRKAPEPVSPGVFWPISASLTFRRQATMMLTAALALER